MTLRSLVQPTNPRSGASDELKREVSTYIDFESVYELWHSRRGQMMMFWDVGQCGRFACL